MKNQYVKASLASVALALLLSPAAATAQVVFSVGAQEVYDSNIFLEDDERRDAATIATLTEGATDPDIIQQVDGDPDDDLISNVFIEAQSALPEFKYVTGSTSGRLGALIMADQSDESRLTVDAAIELSLTENAKPDFLSLSVGDTIQSGTNSIGSATGTATRTSETNDAFLDVGFGEFALFSQTTADFTYRLNRRDFLGEFLFNENDNAPDSFTFKERGADYFTNSVSSTVKHQLNDRVDLGVIGGIEKYDFTHIDSNSVSLTSTDDPDRVDYRGSVFANYTASEQFVFETQAGATYSRFDDERTPNELIITGADGSSSVSLNQPDRDYTSLTFLGGLTYLPAVGTSFKLTVDQGVSTDLDGERTLVRTVRLDGAHEFNDRLTASAGLLFSQFNNDSNLGDSSDRMEVNAGLSYNVTEAIALVAGYNYSTQSTDETAGRALSFNTNEYDVHRAFIGLTAGFVGLSG